MAKNEYDDLPVEERLASAAFGIPETVRGKLMALAAETIVDLRRELDVLRPIDGWVAVDPASGPAVFYLGLDGTLYRYEENDPRPIPGMVDRAVARALLGAALRSLEEADRG